MTRRCEGNFLGESPLERDLARRPRLFPPEQRRVPRSQKALLCEVASNEKTNEASLGRLRTQRPQQPQRRRKTAAAADSRETSFGGGGGGARRLSGKSQPPRPLPSFFNFFLKSLLEKKGFPLVSGPRAPRIRVRWSRRPNFALHARALLPVCRIQVFSCRQLKVIFVTGKV